VFYTQLRFDFDSIDIRLPFDCNSTALRQFDDIRYDRRHCSPMNKRLTSHVPPYPVRRSSGDSLLCVEELRWCGYEAISGV